MIYILYICICIFVYLCIYVYMFRIYANIFIMYI
jgi:hypothetical protein